MSSTRCCGAFELKHNIWYNVKQNRNKAVSKKRGHLLGNSLEAPASYLFRDAPQYGGFMTLEQATKEQTPPTSDVEQGKEPTSEEQPTSEQVARTYTEEDWNKRQSSWDKAQAKLTQELKTLREQVNQKEKASKEFQLSALEAKEIETWGDTPEVKEFHASRRKLEQFGMALSAREMEVNTKLEVLTKAEQAQEARELASKLGIDEKVLLEGEYATPVEMKLRAYELAAEKSETERKAPTKIDSGIHKETGSDWKKLSPEQMIREGLKSRS